MVVIKYGCDQIMMNFTKSILEVKSMMTSERCLIRALLIILAICAVCSKVPDMLGVNPF